MHCTLCISEIHMILDFENKRVLIMGMGISGKGAFNALLTLGAVPFAFDDKYDKVNLSILDDIDMLVLSPTIKHSHPMVVAAHSRGMYVIGELELGYQIHLNKKGSAVPIIAVTGTNGKTTLCRQLAQMLQNAGKSVCLAGNIGVPFSLEVTKSKYDVVVLEVSSFQLMSIDKFSPHIAIITNIAPDHLDIHNDIEEYVGAKLNIFKNQTERDYAIINEDFLMHNSQFSILNCGELLKCRMRNAECRIDAKINLENTSIIQNSEFRIQNSAKTCLHTNTNKSILSKVADILGLSQDIVDTTLHYYVPDRHRIELVDTIGGKKYINDSKATNISATLYAISHFEDSIALILCGSDKGLEYDELFLKMPNNVKHILACGAIAKTLQASALKYNKIVTIHDDLKQATLYASTLDVDTILLSPSSASFDQFKDYKHRGDTFCEIVKELADSEILDLKNIPVDSVGGSVSNMLG